MILLATDILMDVFAISTYFDYINIATLINMNKNDNLVRSNVSHVM